MRPSPASGELIVVKREPTLPARTRDRAQVRVSSKACAEATSLSGLRSVNFAQVRPRTAQASLRRPSAARCAPGRTPRAVRGSAHRARRRRRSPPRNGPAPPRDRRSPPRSAPGCAGSRAGTSILRTARSAARRRRCRAWASPIRPAATSASASMAIYIGARVTKPVSSRSSRLSLISATAARLSPRMAQRRLEEAREPAATPPCCGWQGSAAGRRYPPRRDRGCPSRAPGARRRSRGHCSARRHDRPRARRRPPARPRRGPTRCCPRSQRVKASELRMMQYRSIEKRVTRACFSIRLKRRASCSSSSFPSRSSPT